MTSPKASHDPADALRFPLLRPLDVRPLTHEGRPYLWLRDPLALSDGMVLVPQAVAPLLGLLDGTRDDARAIQASLAVRHGLRVAIPQIEQLLAALDTAFLLDNDHALAAQQRALEAFRAASHRTPISAGGPYPADVAGLRQQLDGYLADVNETPRANIRGLVSPHIDFERGGPVYAAVWQAAAEAARAADLVVILGTDHYGGDGSVTLTRQHYATPYGVLPTDQEAVATLAEAIGQAPAFADELHHRTEHAIELAAVWLHHIRGGKPCSLLPVLCGSFSTFINGERDFNTEPQFRALIAGLQAQVRTRNVLFVAAADLAHVGPAFGGPPIDLRLSCTLKAADDLLIAQMRAGNAAGFLGKIQDVADRFNVCGVPPITLMLDILAPSRGELIAYDRCPADAENASTVTICGMVFR